MNRLLISTFQRVFVREPDGTEQMLLRRDGPYFGLTWDHERLFVGARCWGTSGNDALYIYDRDLRFLEKQSLPGTHGQVHQMLYKDGLIYLLDTPADRIIAWNPDNQRAKTVLNMGNGSNKHHLNSIWWHDGLFWIVGLHGKLWSFDASWNLQTEQSFEFQAHNVYMEDGRVFVGASDRESLMIQECGEQRFINLADYLGVMQDPDDLWHCYTRGMARAGDYLYIGAAAIQDERTERATGRSAIAVFDMQDGPRFKDSIILENTGAMHDFRVLGLDRAHNDIPWTRTKGE